VCVLARISRPHLLAAKSVIICTHCGSDSSRLESRLVLCYPALRLGNSNNIYNNNNTTIRTRRAKCVHKTISLCRHYPEEFWFVLVTCRAINHSHAWHISSLALSFSHSHPLALASVCFCSLFPSLPHLLCVVVLFTLTDSHCASFASLARAFVSRFV